MSFRVTPEFKEKLDQVARQSGRSLAQEIELRLEQSLEQERHLADALQFGFGRQVAALMLAIGLLAEAISPARGIARRDLLSDPNVFGEVVESIHSLLQVIGPDENPTASAAARRALHEPDGFNNAQLSAATLADAIACGEPEFWDGDPLILTIRKWMGSRAAERLAERLRLKDAAAGERSD